MEQAIVDYITQAQKHGLTDFEVKQNLLNAGWEAEVIEDNFVFSRAAQNQTVNLPEIAVQNPVTNPKPALVENIPIQQAASPLVAQPQLASTTDAAASKNSPGSPHSKTIGIIVAVVLLLILAGGASAYYFFIYTNPTKIWQKYAQGGSEVIYQTNYTVSYSDSGSADENASSTSDSNFLGIQLKDIKLTLDGSGYFNTKKPEDPQSQAKIKYTFGAGTTSFSTAIEYMLLNKILYVNAGDNPFISMLTGGAGDKKVSWVKVDLNKLSNQTGSTQAEADFINKISGESLKTALQKIWSNTTLIKMDSYIGKETISGVPTLHYKNSIDKVALKAAINSSVKELTTNLQGTSSQIQPDDQKMLVELTSQIVDKIQIQEFETWIGISDYKLHQIHLLVNAPSVVSLFKNIQSLSMAKSSDAKRLADVRALSSALELYKYDHGGYPEGQAGKPVDLTTNYISEIPQAPTPSSGSCTDYFNGYWYKPAGNKKVVQGKTVYDSYQMTFCLGADTGGYKAGIGKLSPEGITANIACPATPELCVNPNPVSTNTDIRQQIKDFVSKLDFTAAFKADATYTDYNKTINIVPPADAYDILNSTSTPAMGQNGDDAKRLTDIRQMSSAFELYFNEKSKYPDNLSELVPKYISQLPVAPTSTSANCSAEDSAYTYTKTTDASYRLTFCFNTAVSGYAAGKHILSQAGVQ